MLTRRSTGLATHGDSLDRPRVVRLCTNAQRPLPLRKGEAYLSRGGSLPEGFAWYLMLGEPHEPDAMLPGVGAVMWLPSTFDYLDDGDVVRLDAARGAISLLFQKSARHNGFLLTERCNHYCLMCSQPPRNVSDDWIFQDIMDALELVDPKASAINFTGGEPTLLGEKLVRLIRQSESFLPDTSLHILSNGRAFTDIEYVRRIAGIGHHDLMFGIPIYSDLADIHDYVVQSEGAFDETVRGILNLKSAGVQVEIRVVIHKQTFDRLPQLAQFIARNLTFVDQVVFMGLEITGFTRANLDLLWIDPIDYQGQLVEAVECLADSRINVSVYNHQLCTTDRRIWRYARQSISDWKNEYMPECEGCVARQECAGFFSSAHIRHSKYITPISERIELA